MHDGQMPGDPVYWPRMRAILDGLMERWKARWGREPYPGIHEYAWETPQQLAGAVLSGYRAIEPGVPGRETHLVRSLVRGVGGFGKMPLQGPFLSASEIDEIVAWIDAGMPEGPPDENKEGRRKGATMPKIFRVYSGADGESHLEEVPLSMQPFVDTEGAYGEGTPLQNATGITFRVSPPGYALKWHCAPRRQYTITLVGEAEIEVGDGTIKRIGPGDIVLAEDRTGHGHITRVVGNQPRFYAVVPLADA